MPTPRLALTRTFLAPAQDEPGDAPGGGELPGVADVRDAGATTSEETHYDTPDLALAAAGASVRRQTGEGPRGWVLALPGRGPRHHEVRHALGRAVRTAPAALQKLTWAAARGRTLGPVLQLSATARQRELLDAEGRVVARLTTRDVTARPLGSEDAPAQSWAEWQVEVVDGRRDLLDAVSTAWEEAGAEESDRTEQLRTVLDDVETPEEVQAGAGRSGGSGDSGDVVRATLAESVGRLLSQDPLVRIDAPEAVTSMRGAALRLDSLLAVFAPVFAAGPAERLRPELAWLAGVLGAARDAEAVGERVLADLEEEARADSAGPVLQEAVAARRAAAHRDVLAALDDERYRALVTALEEFVAVPPFAEEAGRSPKKRLVPLVAEAHRALKDAYRDVDPDGDESLEPVRAAAQRARCAAELLVPVAGDAADDYADAVRGVLDVVVEHEDARRAAALLESLVPGAGEGAFVLGRLHALEEVRAAVARHDLEEAWHTAHGKKLRRWMR
ncbi:CYTH and CHAD domain-containing protein [Kineococcus terrestris]|uniref:CYTH and CHAD domain-containing protein n=1 Tax=Kineococcus terrestris TaxID=2044856 RepID=UPI0034DB126C